MSTYEALLFFREFLNFVAFLDDQRIVIFNTGAEALFGWRREEVIGKAPDVLIPERFLEIHRQHVGSFAEGSVSARKVGERRSVFGRRKDGTEFPADAAISKLALDGRRLFTVVLRDVTEQKHLVQEKQAAIERRDDVMGMVAHDLRNPLGTVLMLTSLLKRRGSEPTDPPGKTAEAIERATSRMNRLIQDLLDVTRMDSGHLTVEPACVSPLQIVSDCVDSEKGLVASASLEIELELAPNLPCVRADRNRLVQILENLIGNAVKFTKPGGRITVGAIPDGGDVLFWIKDTGIGVAAEHLPHLFDRFWQVSPAEGRRGLGLGLAIVRGLVEAHGGRIWVESTLGEGTTVFFRLPAAPPGQQLHAENEPLRP